MTAAVLFQSMPPLSPEEYAALEASIVASGVQVAVIVDESGVVIDGHHRKRIAESLGIEYPTTVKVGLTETEKRTLALSLNVDRRHLSRDQRRGLIAASLKADPQLADREHARRTGASHPTVAAIRTELETDGQLERLTSRISADGRQRPASQPARPAPEESAEISEDNVNQPSQDFDDADHALTQEECEALDRAEMLTDAEEAEAEVKAARVTGMHGPSSPKPEPKAPRRPALSDTFWRATYDLGKKVTTVTNLAADDRFKKNTDQIRRDSLPDLIRARDALQRVIESLVREPNPLA